MGETVGIRELRQNASGIISAAEGGRQFHVTVRGKDTGVVIAKAPYAPPAQRRRGATLAARIDLIQLRTTFGDGLPFTQRQADIYRELCGVVKTAGRTPGRKRRVDLMIAATAIGDGAALATATRLTLTGCSRCST